MKTIEFAKLERQEIGSRGEEKCITKKKILTLPRHSLSINYQILILNWQVIMARANDLFLSSGEGTFPGRGRGDVSRAFINY